MSCVCSRFCLYVNNTGIVLFCFLSQTDSCLSQWHVCAVFCLPDLQVMAAGINNTFLSVTSSVLLMHGLSVMREIRCLLHFADVR